MLLALFILHFVRNSERIYKVHEYWKDLLMSFLLAFYLLDFPVSISDINKTRPILVSLTPMLLLLVFY